MRQRSIPNDAVPGIGLPPWKRFERFVGAVIKVPKAEADTITEGGPVSSKRAKRRTVSPVIGTRK